MRQGKKQRAHLQRLHRTQKDSKTKMFLPMGVGFMLDLSSFDENEPMERTAKGLQEDHKDTVSHQ